MPSLKKGTTKHHCPMKSHGNCRADGHTYCVVHQKECTKHSRSFLKTESCPTCAAPAKHDQRRADQAYSQQREQEVASSARVTNKGAGPKKK